MSERSSVRLLARWLAAALVILFCCLALLIPGGPIENRDFSHLAPATVWIFNTVLTLLGFSALIVAFFVWKQARWAFNAALSIGLLFAIVDLLDLLHIFPTSPTPMSLLLWSFEMGILFLSGIAILLSIKLRGYSALTAFFSLPQRESTGFFARYKFFILALLFLLSIAAIIFASLSILHSKP